MQRLLIFIIICLSAVSSMAQTAKDEAKLADNLKQYFLHYKPKGTKLTKQPRMLIPAPRYRTILLTTCG